MTREPHYFKETKFYVDGFHMFNHNRCSPLFNISYDAALEYLNTQRVE